MADTSDAAPASPIHAHGTRRLRQCRYGVMLYDLVNAPIGTPLDRYGEYAGMTVVEVGANLGSHTVAFAQAVGPQGRVLAFEPRRARFQFLCANLALNAIDNVEAHWVAVGAKARPVGVRYGALQWRPSTGSNW